MWHLAANLCMKQNSFLLSIDQEVNETPQDELENKASDDVVSEEVEEPKPDKVSLIKIYSIFQELSVPWSFRVQKQH